MRPAIQSKADTPNFAAVWTTVIKASRVFVPFPDIVCKEMSRFRTFRRTANSAALLCRGRKGYFNTNEVLLFFSECFLDEFVEVKIGGVLREDCVKLFVQNGFSGILVDRGEFFEMKELAIKVPILAEEVLGSEI